MAPQPNNNPAPTTDYSTAFNELGSVYDPETTQVNTALAALPGQQQTAQASLDQAKANAFRDIGTNANSRGVFFSGYQPYEQNDYTTTKYNPAVTNLNTKISNQNQTLTEKLAQIQQTRANAAQSLVSDTQSAETVAAKATSSGSGGSGSTKPLTQQATVSAIRGGLEKVKGGDGHVSPGNLAKAYDIWTAQGLNPQSFWTYFQGYWNPNEADYKQLFNAGK